MSHTYAQNVIHVVFNIKDRRKTIPAGFNQRYGPTQRAFAKAEDFRPCHWRGFPRPRLRRYLERRKRPTKGEEIFHTGGRHIRPVKLSGMQNAAHKRMRKKKSACYV